MPTMPEEPASTLKSFTTPRLFGRTRHGAEARLYCLSLPGVLTVVISDFGGIITQLWSPDREGRMADVTLGFGELGPYERVSPYFGALIGRVGNRIAKGRFKLGEINYEVATNNAPGGLPCHLHGGLVGFDKALWKATQYRPAEEPILVLEHFSPDGEEGYPGNLQVTVTYRITPEGALSIEYAAGTDATTLVNLTNHAYFNLRGEGDGTIGDHVLQIRADRFTAVNAGLIPTGDLRPVEGTPFDFRAPARIGEQLGKEDEQLAYGGGFDHNFVLRGESDSLRQVAELYEPERGRVLETYTTEPGMQFYSGNFLDGSLIGKSGRPYPKHAGLCLETQHFPDAPHHPEFPSIVLQADETYRSQTIYRFTSR
jgi:aldose 1-epimerase